MVAATITPSARRILPAATGANEMPLVVAAGAPPIVSLEENVPVLMVGNTTDVSLDDVAEPPMNGELSVEDSSGGDEVAGGDEDGAELGAVEDFLVDEGGGGLLLDDGGGGKPDEPSEQPPPSRHSTPGAQH